MIININIIFICSGNGTTAKQPKRFLLRLLFERDDIRGITLFVNFEYLVRRFDHYLGGEISRIIPSSTLGGGSKRLCSSSLSGKTHYLKESTVQYIYDLIQ